MKVPTRPIDPVAARALVESNRWTSKIQADEETGCIIWTAYLDPAGYGRVKFARNALLAHRIAYVAVSGTDIESGLTLDHLCRNRACVNAAHLEAVSLRVNTLRGGSSSAANAVKTNCPKGHELVEGNLVESDLRRGTRKCRTCHLERTSEQAAAIREAHTRLGLTRHEYRAAYGQSKRRALNIVASLDWAALVSTRNHQPTGRTKRDYSII